MGNGVKFGAFNESIFENTNLKITWFDHRGLVKLKNKLIATITISTHGTSGHYVGYKVTILNKEKEIVNHFFDFSIYLDKNIEIIDYCCQDGYAKWYIKEPSEKDIDKMAKQIEKFINFYEVL
jgi:hypothetical protein